MSDIKFDPKQLLIVPINQVRPNSWNPKDKGTAEFQTVKSSLEEKGLRLPVVVRENKEGASLYEVVDGEQRLTAWQELGNDTVLIYNEGKLSDQEAKELTIWYEQKVPFNEIKLAQLVAEMVSMYDNVILPYDEDKINEMIELSKFDWEQYKEGREEEENKEDGVTLEKIEVTSDQLEVIQRAIIKIKDINPDLKGASDGRCLELICADYLS